MMIVQPDVRTVTGRLIGRICAGVAVVALKTTRVANVANEANFVGLFALKAHETTLNGRATLPVN
ncbi:hypothetical protein LSAT2_016291, partial [Lamellibrachia satsuma]